MGQKIVARNWDPRESWFYTGFLEGKRQCKMTVTQSLGVIWKRKSSDVAVLSFGCPPKVTCYAVRSAPCVFKSRWKDGRRMTTWLPTPDPRLG